MNLIKLMKLTVTRFLFSSWQSTSIDQRHGYTILLPIPGDLPVFLEIALNNIAAQNQENLIEVLVIPDKPTINFRCIYERMIKSYSLPGVRLIEMSKRDQIIGRLINHASLFHFLQIINGVNNSKSTHVLLHDCDLFLSPGNFLQNHFKECVSRDLSILGVNPRERRKGEICHLVATWEMMATVEWFKRFKPEQFRAQVREVNGRTREFDTTHLPQSLSNPQEISFHTINSEFVHFNYVIATYRNFTKSSKPFEDNNFKILLISILIDAINTSTWQYYVPSIENCIDGLTGQDKLVSYISKETALNYPKFREKIEKLLMLNILTSDAIQKIRNTINIFDKKFNWDRIPAGSVSSPAVVPEMSVPSADVVHEAKY